jgi:FMN phosphatase YigB (HAD superfamily)
MRKPEPAIYELTVERIGAGLGAADCLFVDDVEDNVLAARELGMAAVHFRSSDQTIPEVEAALGERGSPPAG